MRELPAPLLNTRSIGQPTLRSIKSTSHSLLISSHVLATFTTEEPQIWEGVNYLHTVRSFKTYLLEYHIFDNVNDLN